MYSAMIVDDEPLMVKYLSANLGRISQDWCVTAMAADGVQAVDLLQQQNFDLVITDIKMPEMDGLELAKYIYEIHPQTKVVIISGFDDFGYAQRAIRCGVSDYLLKPLSDDNIAATLKKVAHSIEESKAKFCSDGVLSNIAQLPDYELKSTLLNEIIQGNTFNIQILYTTLKDRNISLMNQFGNILILGVDIAVFLSHGVHYDEIVSYRNQLHQLCIDTFENNSDITVCYDEFDQIVLLISSNRKEKLEQTISSIFDKINTIFMDQFKSNLIASYGCVVENYSQLQKCYQTALQTLSLSLIGESPPISPVKFISQRIFLNSLNTLISSIYSDFISENKPRIHADLENYIKHFCINNSSIENLRFGVFLLSKIINKSKIINTNFEKAFYQLSILCKTTDKSIPVVADIYLKSILALKKDDIFKEDEEISELIDKAKEYIYCHYSEPISLTLVAEKLGVTASYLSDLFHKEVGESYSKFITRIRMEQAVTWLQANPNEKIYTLAEKVGFINVKHFNSVFKKFYNMTPTEYLLKK